MQFLSLVVPCYNESKNLSTLFDRVKKARTILPSLEIILVDNGSTDNTFIILTEIHKRFDDPKIKIVRVPINKGYGHGILAGLSGARGDWLAWTHADLQTDILDVVRGWDNARRKGLDSKIIIKGRRQDRNLLDVFFTFGMGVLASLTLGRWLFDINAQPKMFPRSLYAMMKDPPGDFSLDLYLMWLAKEYDYSLVTVPVRFQDRVAGEAKGGGTLKGKFVLLKRTFAYIFKLRSRIATA